MKKFYLTILFLALSFIGFAQQRGNLFVVPHWTTNFTMSLPAQSLVQCTDSGKIYRLLAIGQPTKNLSNTANVVYPTSVGHADSSNVSGFAWLVDSMHIYYYWNVDSLLFDNAYGGNIHCDSIWATTHYSVSAFDTTQSVDTINANIMYLNTFVLNPLLSTSDSIAVFSNDTLKYKLLDMTPYLKFSDTTSTLLTQSKASNTYQLKYWSKTGTAITPYTSTDTVVSKYQRISGMFPTATTLLEVTSTGLLDTIASTPIDPIYVKKAGDTLNGDFHLTGGTFSLDTYAATSQKSLITQPSGLIDTVPMVTIDDAVISSITLTDSISIGGIVTISDTILVADEDSIYFKRGKSGWACIYADSSGTIVAWANFYWDSNGTPHLQNNSSRVVASNTDTNVICLYAYGSGLVMRNRSGSTMKFKTVLNY